MIVCDECGNTGYIEIIHYVGNSLNDFREHEIFIGRSRFFRAFYRAIHTECKFLPGYNVFEPSSGEDQILFEKALEKTGMRGQLGRVKTFTKPCYKCGEQSIFFLNVHRKSMANTYLSEGKGEGYGSIAISKQTFRSSEELG
jgi:hypothetical protein